jgi:sugar (pentulose or hexulose) kinase
MYSPKLQQLASSSAQFLGLDLGRDNLRAVIVDDQLDVQLVEVLNFDQDIPDLQ